MSKINYFFLFDSYNKNCNFPEEIMKFLAFQGILGLFYNC